MVTREFRAFSMMSRIVSGALHHREPRLVFRHIGDL